MLFATQILRKFVQKSEKVSSQRVFWCVFKPPRFNFYVQRKYFTSVVVVIQIDFAWSQCALKVSTKKAP